MLQLYEEGETFKLEAMPRTPHFRIPALILAVIANGGFFLPELGEVGNEAAAIPFSDKAVHVGIFALTAWALLRITCRPLPHSATATATARNTARRPLMIAVLSLFAWAWIIEGIQSLMPARSADVRDVIADSIGIAVGYALFRLETRSAR